MKRRLVAISFNSISAIPVFRLILTGLDRALFSGITVVECFVEGMSTRFSIDGYQHVDMIHFPTASRFYNQSRKEKCLKYLKTIYYLFRYAKNDNVLYICDLEVLALVILVKSIKRSRCNVVYHQFETVDHSNMNAVKRLSAAYLRQTKKVDIAVFPEKNRLKLFLQLINAPALNTFLFPNTCYPKPLAGPVEKERGGKFTIGHIGNLSSTAFYLNQFLAAARTLPAEKVELIFVGVKDKTTEEYIRSQVPGAVIIGWLRHEELRDIYKKLDLGLILYKPLDFNTEYCAPNKLYEYWSYGVPVLAPTLKGLIGIFDTPQKGMLADFEDTEQVKAALIRLQEQTKEGSKGELIRHFNETMSVELVIREFQSELKKIIHG